MREAAQGRSLETKFPAEEVASASPREREEFGDFFFFFFWSMSTALASMVLADEYKQRLKHSCVVGHRE